MQELWRGDGRMGGGDLLHYLLRGRKEHVTRVKVGQHGSPFMTLRCVWSFDYMYIILVVDIG